MIPAYIYASSAVSTQDSFLGADFVNNLERIEAVKEIKIPVYREFIKPMLMRRMGKATKMSIACAFNCMRQLEMEQPEAIIVGTGLGALTDTEKFLSVSTATEEKMLPPTAFIASGHNTIAGQIALLLKNDLYNMTHVQRELSFEYAVLDAMLSVTEGKDNILTGAFDELTPKVMDLAERFELDSSIKNQLSGGAAFFVLGNNKAKAITEIRSVEILEFSDLSECILAFLEKNNVSENTTLKGFVGFNLQPKSEINLPFETLCYTDFCGRFFTSSSFGTHLASSHLMANANSGDSALVINLVSEKQVALTLLQRV